MPRAGGVLRQQDVAGVEQEVVAVTRLEIERSAERDHQLPDRRGVPGERTARFRFLKGDAGGIDFSGQEVAALPRLQLEEAFLEMRVVVLSGPKAHTADHRVSPCIVVAPPARRRSDRNGTSASGSRTV